MTPLDGKEYTRLHPPSQQFRGGIARESPDIAGRVRHAGKAVTEQFPRRPGQDPPAGGDVARPCRGTEALQAWSKRAVEAPEAGVRVHLLEERHFREIPITVFRVSGLAL